MTRWPVALLGTKIPNARLHDKRAMKHNRQQLLLFRLGTRLCSIPIEQALETMRPLPIEPIAGSPPYVLGLAIIRREALPVVDLATLLGIENMVRARFITIRTGSRRAAMAVGEVLGVRTFLSGCIEELAPLLCDADPAVISGIARLDAELLLVLRSAHIVPESVWDNMADRGSVG